MQSMFFYLLRKEMGKEKKEEKREGGTAGEREGGKKD